MDDEAIEEQRKRWKLFAREQEAKGICPHSGERFRVCKAADICDCFDYPEHDYPVSQR